MCTAKVTFLLGMNERNAFMPRTPFAPYEMTARGRTGSRSQLSSCFSDPSWRIHQSLETASLCANSFVSTTGLHEHQTRNLRRWR